MGTEYLPLSTHLLFEILELAILVRLIASNSKSPIPPLPYGHHAQTFTRVLWV